MKQGNLFDDLYTDQEADFYDDHIVHSNANGLYPTAKDGVLKQKLVTYYKVKGGIKRGEKTRNFYNSDYNDTTTIEVFK